MKPLNYLPFLCAAAALAGGSAQETETPAPAETSPAKTWFEERLPEAITQGKVNINARLRYEWVDQDGLPGVTRDSHAFTLRTRLGYTTAPLHGFQGMLEAENITAIPNDRSYNAAGTSGQPFRPVVADPPATELNQAWISYSNWDTTVRGGRQRIVLDNHRFIGDVGWRQNMQTFDSVLLENRSIEDLSLTYAYLWEVRRVFGDVSGLPPGLRNFNSDSHVFNASYTVSPLARLTAYSYLLDLRNPAGAAASSATHGGFITGGHTFDQERNARINYRAEFAWQTDYAGSPLDYSAPYYNVEAGGDFDRYTLGAGYEVLGSGRNKRPGPARAGFQTPLATLHAFNGWADVFLNTPPNGLRDLYAFAGARLPGNIPLRVAYHKYDADFGRGDYGHEINVMASRRFGKHWTGLIKYARYDGKDAPAAFDLHKFWAQVEFNF